MAKLSRDDVLHIAKLARLKFSDTEVEKFQMELTAILQYVEQLNEVDTEGVEPVSQITGLKMVTRKDEMYPSDATKEELLACSPLPIVDDHIQTLSAHG
jgi:aspartyl-tRNA(Asn)/glutamyl-tRNA(Gln) amidotransferase subunit C